MGHDTHGLGHAPPYLAALDDGRMAKDGTPEVIAEHGGNLTWDGNYLSGVWLVDAAMDAAFQRVADHGVATVVIRRSHHIACLAAYLPKATERGYMAILASSDPSVRAVAPFGSYAPTFTPDPIAVGIPTDGDPVLIDISASTTTMALANRKVAAGERLPGPWLVDNEGAASDDPAVLHTDPPGAFLPLGGMDRGHKGFGLALMIEALTAGLGGYGRADGADKWGAAVFLQVIDPGAFGGRGAFAGETGWLAAACRAAPVAAGSPPVRLPGDGALARKREALAQGCALFPTILDDLAPWAEKLGVAMPREQHPS